MKFRVLRVLFFVGFILFAPRVWSQNPQVNPASVDVNQMSDEQIKKMLAEMEKRGLGVEEAIALARAKGATQQQIDQMRRRIEALKWSSRGDSTLMKGIEEEELLNKEEEFSQKAEFELEEEEEELNVFGFQFFNTENLSFAPNVNVPVSDNYALGNGDEVVINVYGASQQTYTLQVERNGMIQIPDLGPVHVGGLPFKEVVSRIQKRLVSIYNGMQGEHPNTFAEVSLGQLKGINVNVIGEVYVPGTYTLPATASAFNALYLAGGPNSTGSFRRIDVIRDGVIYRSIDVYSYLIDGITDDNVQLRDMDVVLVRPYGLRVSVGGEFKRQGVYEAKEGEKVSDLIRYAGGFAEKAYTHRVDLYRNNSRTLSFKDVVADDFDRVVLQSGDSLVAGVIADRFDNRVSVEGAVYRPGDYELNDGGLLSDLLDRAEGVKEEAFLERGVITRKKKDMSMETISFSVKDVLAGKADVELQREDRVQISSIFEMREARTVEVFGEVQFQGTYAFSEHMLLKDLIFQAGGFKENADVSGIEVARRLSYDEASQLGSQLLHTYQFSVDRDLKLADEDANFELMPFDHVYIRQAPGFRPQGTVMLEGEVKYAGVYGITRKQERLSEVIKRAGWVTPEAYVRGASLRRKVELSEAEYEARVELAKRDTTLDEEDVKKIDYTVVGIQLDEILQQPGGDKDIFVEDGDQILIPSRMQTVKVSGAVLSPVALTCRKGLRLKNYIYQSGGFADDAKKSKTYVLYANGTTSATKGVLFWRKYPRIEPGCEIIVPAKPEVDKAAAATRWMAFASTLASLITAVAVATR
ncbi:MAG: SLBB domain-containing protein [Marinifilaceae bacterium]